ncbi:SDR family oxidoreductase [Nocardia brasiliensis]|uniref:Short-chain dehydrogenase/reductase SDR n=1 Tax=Nocardia brasiliensis (strain ATCC 700358 / HUJEG-1) TaxID=1133849 RepID=K0ERL4_NOCB7|nr:SDR family oxidoreductase [Nocardia brasiliensis]AFT98305.1 short-chain dehydrogenase/reductase SDR [Nocardia brasiliensis ATCC 700358]OCF90956.1 hypothetical protein AW168_09020 [Nocardia brasiliensis]
MRAPAEDVTGTLAGKTVLITGGDTGVGKKIAVSLAAQGAQVVIQHPHAPESAADVVKEITGSGGSALALAADIGDRLEYEELVQALLEECGHWDVLVTTTAAALSTSLAELTADEFDSAFATPARGVLHGLQLASAHLADGGRVITVANAAPPGNTVDEAATGAIAEFTRALAADFTPRRIAVNAVSAATGNLDPNATTAARLLGPVSETTEISEVVAFLASDAAEAVTAQHIRVAEGGPGTGKTA